MRNNVGKPEGATTLQMDPNDVGKQTWEWRVFWHDHSFDTLHSGNFPLFADKEPAKVVEEENEDTYILLPGRTHLNLKLRENEVFTKCRCAVFGVFNAYWKKRVYGFPLDPFYFYQLTGLSAKRPIRSPEEFTRTILLKESQSRLHTICKLRKKARFTCAHQAAGGVSKLNVEFSHIRIDRHRYDTLCLESRNSAWLHDTVKNIDIGNGIAANYCDFLSGARDKLPERAGL